MRHFCYALTVLLLTPTLMQFPVMGAEEPAAAKLDALNKEIEAKSQPGASKEDKKAASALKKEAKALAKDLDKAKSASKQARKEMLAQMQDMYSRHVDAMKGKYRDVEARIKATP